MCSDQTAIAFFESKEITAFSGGLKLQDLLPDVFKTCQDFDQADLISLCNGVCQVGGYDSLDQITVVRKTVHCFSLSDLIIRQQAAGHISGQDLIITGRSIFHINAQTVCIRIGRQHQVCVHFFCKLQSQFKRFFCFRIRIGYGRELSIRQFLLLDYIHVGKAKLF